MMHESTYELGSKGTKPGYESPESQRTETTATELWTTGSHGGPEVVVKTKEKKGLIGGIFAKKPGNEAPLATPARAFTDLSAEDAGAAPIRVKGESTQGCTDFSHAGMRVAERRNAPTHGGKPGNPILPSLKKEPRLPNVTDAKNTEMQDRRREDSSNSKEEGRSSARGSARSSTFRKPPIPKLGLGSFLPKYKSQGHQEDAYSTGDANDHSSVDSGGGDSSRRKSTHRSHHSSSPRHLVGNLGFGIVGSKSRKKYAVTGIDPDGEFIPDVQADKGAPGEASGDNMLVTAFFTETQRLESELQRLRRENQELKTQRSGYSAEREYELQRKEEELKQREASLSNRRSSWNSPQSRDEAVYQKPAVPRLDFGKLSGKPNIGVDPAQSHSAPPAQNPAFHAVPGLEGQQQLSVFNCNLSPVMLNGGYLWKIPSSGSSPRRRWFQMKPCAAGADVYESVTVCSGQDRIFWPLTLIWRDQGKKHSASRELKRSLLMADVNEIKRGHQTPTFWNMISVQGPLDVPLAEVCFSICYQGGKTMDLAAENAGEADMWYQGLLCLVNALQSVDGPPAPYSLQQTGPQRSDDSSSVGSAATYQTNRSYDSGQKKYRASERNKWRDAIFSAVKTDNVLEVERLLDLGCPVDVMEEGTGDTPLLAAARLGFVDVVSCCLDRGARNDPHPTFGQTALQAAVTAGKVEVVRLILEIAAPSKADQVIVNHEDPNKEAPLHISSRCGYTDLVEILLMHGAQLGLVDGKGWTCLHSACKGGHAHTLAYLLDAGGDAFLEEKDLSWNRPLHVAAENGKASCVKLLLETAAVVRAANSSGRTPFQLAFSNGHHSVTKMLLEYDPHARDPEGPPVPLQKILNGLDPGSVNNTHRGPFLSSSEDLPRPSLSRSSTARSSSTEGYSMIKRVGSDGCVDNGYGSLTDRPMREGRDAQQGNGLFEGLDLFLAGKGGAGSSSGGVQSTWLEENDGSQGGSAHLPVWEQSKHQTGSAAFSIPQGLNTARDMLRAMHLGTGQNEALNTPSSMDASLYEKDEEQGPDHQDAQIQEEESYQFNEVAVAVDDQTTFTDQSYNEYGWEGEYFYVGNDQWQLCYTTEGYAYYIECSTGNSQWEDPREQVDATQREAEQNEAASLPRPRASSRDWSASEIKKASGVSKGRLLLSKSRKSKDGADMDVSGGNNVNSGNESTDVNANEGIKSAWDSGESKNPLVPGGQRREERQESARSDQFESPRSQASPGKDTNGRPLLSPAFNSLNSSPSLRTAWAKHGFEGGKSNSPKSDKQRTANSPKGSPKSIRASPIQHCKEPANPKLSIPLPGSILSPEQSPYRPNEQSPLRTSPIAIQGDSNAQFEDSDKKMDFSSEEEDYFYQESRSARSEGRRPKLPKEPKHKAVESDADSDYLSPACSPLEHDEKGNLNASSESLYFETESKKQTLGLQISSVRLEKVTKGLYQFKKQFSSWHELCRAIVKQEENILSLIDLQALGPILPTSEELQNSQGYKKEDLSYIIDAEAFFICTSRFRRFSRKLDAFMFRLGYEPHITSLRSKINLITRAYKQVNKDKKMQHILQAAYDSPDEINDPSFPNLTRLNQLEKLSQSDKLLSTIIEKAESNGKIALFSLPEDLSEIHAVADIVLSRVFNEVAATYKHLQKMKKELQRETQDLRQEQSQAKDFEGIEKEIHQAQRTFRSIMAKFVEEAEVTGKEMVSKSQKIEAELETLAYIDDFQADVDKVFKVLSKFLTVFEKARDWDAF